MGQFRQAAEGLRFGDPARREAWRDAFLASLDEWLCPRCGEPVAAPRGRRVEDRRCIDCIRDPQRCLSREQRLAAVGTPARYRQPFIERAWPTAVQRVGSGWATVKTSIELWAGEPFAVGFVGLSKAGKTFLATELFYRQIQRASEAKRPVRAWWTTAAKIVDSGFGDGADRELYRECLQVRLLLIDDLGWGAGIEKLFALISDRHGAMLPTIWTANATLSDLAQSQVGQPLLTRLGDDGLVCGVTGRWGG